MRLKYSSILIAFASLGLLQCSAPAMRHKLADTFFETGHAAPGSAGHWSLDPAFRMGMRILSGFDTPREDATWEPNDWILLGVKVDHGSESDVWFVRVSTLQPLMMDDAARTPRKEKFTAQVSAGSIRQGTAFMLPVGTVRIDCFNRHGKRMYSSVRMTPLSLPTASIFDACAALLSKPGDPARALVRNPYDATFTMLTTLQSIGATRSLAPIRQSIREHVVKEPSVLGLVLRGLQLKLDADLSGAELIQEPWSATAALSPRYRVRTPVSLSGQRLLDCQLIVAPSKPPYHLTGGLLQFEAVHPEKPQNRLTVRLLAAKQMPSAGAAVADAGPASAAVVSKASVAMQTNSSSQ